MALNFYKNPQNPADQPTRGKSGNASEVSGTSEKHGQTLSKQLKIGADAGDTKALFGNEFIQGGNNPAGASQEKHDQTKDKGKRFVGGKPAGDAPVVSSDIQRSERRHGAGNKNFDGYEQHSSCSDSTDAYNRAGVDGIDMDTDHRF